MATDWFDGRIARSRGHFTALGSLLDPAADKILVLAVLVMLVDQHVVPGWMVALIVVREFLVTALRLAAIERESSSTPATSASSRPGHRQPQRPSAASRRQAPGGNQVAWWALLVALASPGSRGWTTPGPRPASGGAAQAA